MILKIASHPRQKIEIEVFIHYCNIVPLAVYNLSLYKQLDNKR
jgi:hypothetical protein